MICEVADVEGLILDRLSFFDQRILNQVSTRYRDKMNARYRALYSSQKPDQVFTQMLAQGDLEACRWLWAREKDQLCLHSFTLEYVLKAKNLALLQWYRSVCSGWPFQWNYDPRETLTHLLVSLRTNCPAIYEYFHQEVEQRDEGCFLVHFSFPLPFLHGLTLETVQWFDRWRREKGHPIDWSAHFRLAHNRFLTDGQLEVYLWLQQITGLVLPIESSVCLATRSLEVLQWLTQVQQMDLRVHYPSLWSSAVAYSSFSILEWLLQQGYRPELSERQVANCNLNVLSLLLAYAPTPAFHQCLRNIYRTRTMRFPPHPKYLYVWISQQVIPPS